MAKYLNREFFFKENELRNSSNNECIYNANNIRMWFHLIFHFAQIWEVRIPERPHSTVTIHEIYNLRLFKSLENFHCFHNFP